MQTKITDADIEGMEEALAEQKQAQGEPLGI